MAKVPCMKQRGVNECRSNAAFARMPRDLDIVNASRTRANKQRGMSHGLVFQRGAEVPGAAWLSNGKCVANRLRAPAAIGGHWGKGRTLGHLSDPQSGHVGNPFRNFRETANHACAVDAAMKSGPA